MVKVLRRVFPLTMVILYLALMAVIFNVFLGNTLKLFE